MPESTAMVIYTVLNPAYSRNFFSSSTTRAPTHPRRALHARCDCCLISCCLLKDYTFFRAIHILKVYTFYGYTYFRVMHFFNLSYTYFACKSSHPRRPRRALHARRGLSYAIICTPLPTLKSAIICTHIDVFYSHFMYTFISTLFFSFYVHLYIPNKKTAGSFI